VLAVRLSDMASDAASAAEWATARPSAGRSRALEPALLQIDGLDPAVDRVQMAVASLL
jgi:hypothetical protein